MLQSGHRQSESRDKVEKRKGEAQASLMLDAWKQKSTTYNSGAIQKRATNIDTSKAGARFLVVITTLSLL